MNVTRRCSVHESCWNEHLSNIHGSRSSDGLSILAIVIQKIENYPGKRPQTVCVRSISRKSRRIGVQRGDGGDEGDCE